MSDCCEIHVGGPVVVGPQGPPGPPGPSIDPTIDVINTDDVGFCLFDITSTPDTSIDYYIEGITGAMYAVINNGSGGYVVLQTTLSAHGAIKTDGGGLAQIRVNGVFTAKITLYCSAVIDASVVGEGTL